MSPWSRWCPDAKAAERLGEIIPRAIAEIPWPKTMYWTGAAGLRFIRPIRWVVALLGGQKVPLEVGGRGGGNGHVGPSLSGQIVDSRERI